MKTNKLKMLLIASLAVGAGSISSGYEVWLGLPYMPKESAASVSQWSTTAQLLKGMNSNVVDAQRPTRERNTTDEWKKIISYMPTAKNNTVLEFPRTHFNYGTNTRRGTLTEVLVTKFKNETKYKYKIKWVMPFANQPGEDRTLPAYSWSSEDLQEMRDWLDSNGHSDTKIISNVRNNATSTHTEAQKSIIDGVSIEGKPELWFGNKGRRQNFLKWALGNYKVKNKHFKFQIPFGKYKTQNEYQAIRGMVRWLSTSAMLGNTDFIRRSNVSLLLIVYDDHSEHLPESVDNGKKYTNTILSTALSLMEQQSDFEGRSGLISEDKVNSYTRGSDRAPVYSYIDNKSNAVRYSGRWSSQNNGSDFKGSMSYSAVSGNYAEMSFRGKHVAVAVRKGRSGGKCNVYVDGRLVASNVDTYATSSKFKKVIYKGDLNAGSHTVRLEATGQKRWAARGANVMFDYFKIEK